MLYPFSAVVYIAHRPKNSPELPPPPHSLAAWDFRSHKEGALRLRSRLLQLNVVRHVCLCDGEVHDSEDHYTAVVTGSSEIRRRWTAAIPTANAAANAGANANATDACKIRHCINRAANSSAPTMSITHATPLPFPWLPCRCFFIFSHSIDDRVSSLTGEKTYRLVDGKPARRPSGTTSPYTIQSPACQPWAATTSPVVHSPGPVMHSPGHVTHSSGHVIHSNPGHVLHSPGHVMLSPTPAALQAGYGAPQYAATTMVPYHQPGHGGGVAPPGNPSNPTPTPTGEAVGYNTKNYYVRPRRSKKSWMWTQQ